MVKCDNEKPQDTLKNPALTASGFSAGEVAGVAIGEKRGISKTEVPFIDLKDGYGILNDAHAGTRKQVSLVAVEDIEYMNKIHGINAKIGAFAENIATKGIELMVLSPGQKVRVGPALLKVVSLGKGIEEMKKHTFSYKGYTLLPRRGLFCEVLKGGRIKPGDKISVLTHDTLKEL